MQLLVFSHHQSERLKYIFRTIIWERIGLRLIFINNLEAYEQAVGAKLNYSDTPASTEELHIRPYGLLEKNTIEPQEIELVHSPDSVAFFFRVLPTKDFDFDPFAAAFFILSRYEEYLPFKADVHGRFLSAESSLHHPAFLFFPIIDHWVIWMKQKLSELFPFLLLQQSKFNFQATYDIDIAWAYLHRNWWRTLGGLLQDIKSSNHDQFQERWRVLTRTSKDTFDTYSLLASHTSPKPIYFFLLGDYGKYDKNIAHSSFALQQLIQKVAQRGEVGIHPSYQASSSFSQLEKEVMRLERIIGKPVTASRQHFLKLTFPDTYRNLLQVGIWRDYSMGYADTIGYRAGTSQPFYWYDLQKEETTPLQIFPFVMMDVTLKDYLKLSPDSAMDAATSIINHTKLLEGNFSFLWHNSSFSHIGGWEGWQEVYLSIVKQAQYWLDHPEASTDL